MDTDYGLNFHYCGSSFNQRIELNSLKNVLNWVKLIGKQFDKNIEIYILPFEEGSFRFWIADYKDVYKNVIWGVLTTGVTWLIGLLIFTNWEDYQVHIDNSMKTWNIIIINNNWEQKEFSQDILPYIWNENIQSGLNNTKLT